MCLQSGLCSSPRGASRVHRILIDCSICIDIDDAMHAKLTRDADGALDVELTLAQDFKQQLQAEQVDILTITREEEDV